MDEIGKKGCDQPYPEGDDNQDSDRDASEDNLVAQETLRQIPKRTVVPISVVPILCVVMFQSGMVIMLFVYDPFQKILNYTRFFPAAPNKWSVNETSFPLPFGVIAVMRLVIASVLLPVAEKSWPLRIVFTAISIKVRSSILS